MPKDEDAPLAELLDGLHLTGEMTAKAIISEVYERPLDYGEPHLSRREDGFLKIRAGIAELLPELGERKPTATRVGKLLGSHRGKIVAGKKMSRRVSSGHVYWRVDVVEKVDVGEVDLTPPTSTKPTADAQEPRKKAS